jgi:uncharacterized membrane protein YczE
VRHIPDFKQRLGFLGLSILMNATGNGLTIATALGSAVWTGSSVNLANWWHISLGTTLLLYGIVITITNQLLLGHFDRRRLISNLLFALPFSYLVALMTFFWRQIGVPQTSLIVRLLLDVLGIFIVSAAVSIYQRANLIMHPNDDFAYILRFKYLHGSAILGQWLSYTPPVALTIAAFVATGQLQAIGFGTLVALTAQGALMAWSDRHVFQRLKHHVDL